MVDIADTAVSADGWVIIIVADQRGAGAVHLHAILRRIKEVPNMKVSVVIPVFNERATVAQVLSKVRASFKRNALDGEMVVVDDGSTDGTSEILKTIEKEIGFSLLVHKQNQGKGAAIRTGLAAVTGGVVVIQDADLEYNPDEYGLLVQPIFDGNADVVYGSRFMPVTQLLQPFWHTWINKFITLVCNMVTNVNFTDVETCYKAFKREVISAILIESKGFSMDIELTVKLARMKLRICEVPIKYTPRTIADGKKIRWTDGVCALYAMLKYSLGK